MKIYNSTIASNTADVSGGSAGVVISSAFAPVSVRLQSSLLSKNLLVLRKAICKRSVLTR